MSWRRIRNTFRSDQLGDELDEELAFHIAELTDDLVAEGKNPMEARREARRRFGNLTARKEETRNMNIARSVEAFAADLRYGARQLRLNPGFAAVAVLSLALGIGANSAIFQLINALRLRALPVPNADQLVAVVRAPDFYTSGWYSGRHQAFTHAQLEQMMDQQRAFSGLLAFNNSNFNLSQGGEARYAEGLYVSPNFLEVLQVAPMLGRWISPQTDPRDCADAGALLGHAFWQRDYGGDVSVVGRDITLNGREFPILGVTPPSVVGLDPAHRFDVALPLCADGLLAEDGQGRMANMTAWWLTPIGRLKPDWSVERASSHFRDISPGIFEATQPAAFRPEDLKKYVSNKLRVVSAQAGVSRVREEYMDPLWILLASTGLVLVIACANLANLLLSRASARSREVALRQAVGASRRRLVAQLMAESSLLAALGAAMGGVLAYGLSRAMVLFLNQGDDRLAISLGMDWRVFGFTAALALATCLLFGLAPATRATKGAPADVMRGGRGSAGASENHGLRRALVVSQIALSLVLLVGALLFGQSLRNLLKAETGIDSDGVMIARVNANLPDAPPERRRGVFSELEARIGGLPDVESCAAVSVVPFSGNTWNHETHADDDPSPTGGHEAYFTSIGPGYFETLRTPLLAGRDIGPHDDSTAESVAVVNQRFARDLFGESNPIGRSFRYRARADVADPVFRIVGVVADTKYETLREDPKRLVFLPVAQEDDAPTELSFVVRARGSMGTVTAGVREQLAEVDPGLLVEFDVLDLQASRTVLRERLMASLSGGFGLLAALLSTLGLYAVMSYMVARRRTEIGVRMALGAARRDIGALVFGEAGRLLAVGLGLGLAGSFALSRWAESLLFGLEPNDGRTLALGCALLAATAFGAALMPVRRATSLHPAAVLRDE